MTFSLTLLILSLITVSAALPASSADFSSFRHKIIFSCLETLSNINDLDGNPRFDVSRSSPKDGLEETLVQQLDRSTQKVVAVEKFLTKADFRDYHLSWPYIQDELQSWLIATTGLQIDRFWPNYNKDEAAEVLEAAKKHFEQHEEFFEELDARASLLRRDNLHHKIGTILMTSTYGWTVMENQIPTSLSPVADTLLPIVDKAGNRSDCLAVYLQYFEGLNEPRRPYCEDILSRVQRAEKRTTLAKEAVAKISRDDSDEMWKPVLSALEEWFFGIWTIASPQSYSRILSGAEADSVYTSVTAHLQNDLSLLKDLEAKFDDIAKANKKGSVWAKTWYAAEPYKQHAKFFEQSVPSRVADFRKLQDELMTKHTEVTEKLKSRNNVEYARASGHIQDVLDEEW